MGIGILTLFSQLFGWATTPSIWWVMRACRWALAPLHQSHCIHGSIRHIGGAGAFAGL